jgi:hypothetical protein
MIIENLVKMNFKILRCLVKQGGDCIARELVGQGLASDLTAERQGV